MILGIGVDIAATGRFQRFLDEGKISLIDRLFTEQERTACQRRKDLASCYAARFAAKEAFLKALGTGLRDGISWQDMDVRNNRLGKPEMHLSGAAVGIFLRLGAEKLHLSLSHDGGHAVAMVILEAT